MTFLYITAVLLLAMTELSAFKCPSVNIVNGFTKLHARGQVIKFFCNKGFRRYGNPRARCRSTGWNKAPPICYAPGCAPYKSLTNGNITSFGTFLMLLRCHEGFILMGFNAMYCNGSSWSAPLPECKVPADVEVCDLEYDNLCGWSQDEEDDFDWIWHKGQTPTGWTGPEYDHTYLNEEGHYLYLEMSPPRMRGDIARLISPTYGSSKSGRCFSFWYHMLGPKEPEEVGSLRVIMKHLLTEENTTLLEIHGNQGDLWKSAEVYIEKTNGSFQIIIEGKREKTYVGDIAVDDFRFFNCTAPDIITSTSDTRITALSEDETTNEPETTIVDVKTIETTSQFSKLSTETSRVKTTMTSLPVSEFPHPVSQSSISSSSVTSDKEYQKTQTFKMKTVKFTTVKVMNKKQLTNKYNADLTSTSGYEMSSNKNGNLFTLGVTGSRSKTTLDASRNRITSNSFITGSEGTTLKSTGSGSTSTYTIRGSEHKFLYSGLTTVSSGSSLKNYTDNHLKAGDLSEHLIQNKIFIIVISVCAICVTAIVVLIIIFICRKRKSRNDDPLEEMKTHFVYKKSVDFTLSTESMSEGVCNQVTGLPVRDLL